MKTVFRYCTRVLTNYRVLKLLRFKLIVVSHVNGWRLSLRSSIGTVDGGIYVLATVLGPLLSTGVHN